MAKINTKKKDIKTYNELDNLVSMIDSKDKNINALQKTKIDWEKHTKEQNIEAELEKNRKDGYLAKQAFLGKVGEVEYQQKKEMEK